MQIAYKESGRIIKVDHIGSAHTESDLKTLLRVSIDTNLDHKIVYFRETRKGCESKDRK